MITQPTIQKKKYSLFSLPSALFLLCFAFFFFGMLGRVYAAVPDIINYQGRLEDSSGNLLGGTGTNYDFKFSIWDSASGGSRLWPVSAPASTTLTVTNGVFSVGLGDAAVGFPALNLSFNNATPYYLQIEVWNATSSAFETLTPRQAIDSSGFAVNAATLNGYTEGTSANNLLQLDANGNINLPGGQIRTINTSTCSSLVGIGSGALCYDTTANNLFVYNGSSSSWTSIAGFTNPGFVTAASSVTWTALQNFNAGLTANSTATFNSSTVFANVTSSLLKTNSSGVVVAAIPGTDYLTSLAGALLSANNLNDLTSTSSARSNLGFTSGSQISISATGTIGLATTSISQFNNDSGYLTSLSGALLAANNLSDLTNSSTARSNIGLGNLANALQLIAANNLSDLTSTSSARSNIGLGNVANALQLIAANNLSDLTSTSSARTNIGFTGGSKITISATGTIGLATTSISQFNNDSGYLTTLSGALLAANNLSDLTNTSTARTNIGLGNLANALQLIAANNLSDLTSTSSARTNLGLGSAATQNTSAFLQTINNLSDLNSTGTARINIGLGNLANALQLVAANNLSDLTSTSSARGNIGLGNVANALQLIAANNLSDLTSTSSARTNLGFTGGNKITISATGTIGLTTSSISQFANDSGYLTSLSGALLAVNNLSDLNSTSSARSNIGLGNVTNSLQLVAANNLSDLTNTSTARTNIGFSNGTGIAISGLGAIGFSTTSISQFSNDAGYLTTSTGLTVTNFASPNISQWTNNSGYISSSTGNGLYLQILNNLSDLNSTSSARTNIGLGNLANTLQLVAANNLSDLTSTSSARTNIGFTGGSKIAISATGTIGLATTSISQFNNDLGYLTTSTGLSSANFTTSSVGQWVNNGLYALQAIQVNSGGILSGGGALSGNQTISLSTSTLYSEFSGTSPITFNSSTGVIGWTNSNNYISQIGINGFSGTAFNLLGSGNVTTTVTNGSTTFSLINSGVAAGSYTNANITISSSGVITAASNGSAGGGSGTVTTSSALTTFDFPYWSNTTGGLSGTSTLFFASSTGNIGIGTTTPAYTLTVAGTSYNLQTSTFAGNTVIGSLSVPSAPTLATTTGGSFAAASTNYFKITGIDNAGNETPSSTEASITTGAANNEILVSWIGIPGAVYYKAYIATSSGAELAYASTTLTSFTFATSTIGAANGPTATSTPPTSNNTILTQLGGGLSWLNVASGTIADTQNGIASSTVNGLVLQNITPAIAGASTAGSQYSPALTFIGQGWKTNATAGSQQVSWKLFDQPYQGSANPTNALIFSPVTNGTVGDSLSMCYVAVNGTGESLDLSGGTSASNCSQAGFGPVNAGGQFGLFTNSAERMDFGITNIQAAQPIVWGATIGNANTGDIGLWRNGVGTLEFNNGTTGQLATTTEANMTIAPSGELAANVTLATTTGGSLAAGNYTVQIVGVDANGGLTTPSAAKIITAIANNIVSSSWVGIPGISYYQFWFLNGINKYATTTNTFINISTTTTMTAGTLNAVNTSLMTDLNNDANGSSSFIDGFGGGNLGIGTTAPLDILSIGSSLNQSATHALLNLNNTALVSGNASGTYIGANVASGFNGDFIDFQVNNSSTFKVAGTGATTVTVSSTLALAVQDSSANNVLAVNTTASSTSSGIDITAGGSQTADLLDLYSSSSLVITGFTKNGYLFIGTSTMYGTTTTLTVCARSNCTTPSATTSTNTVAFFGSTDGTTGGSSIIARGTVTSGQADVGEYIPVNGSDTDYGQGDVVSVMNSTTTPQSPEFQKSQGAYDTNAAGVVTITAGLIAGGGADAHGTTVIALAGRVPVKVTDDNGPIQIGDYLTASDIPGVAMRSTEPGRVIGIALQSYSSASSTSSSTPMVMMFVNPHWSLGNLTDENAIASSSWALSGASGVLDQFTIYVKYALQKLGLAISNGIATVHELFADTVTTNQLCVGTTCINQQQLAQLLSQENIAGGNSGGQGSGGSSGGGGSQVPSSLAPSNIVTSSTLGIIFDEPFAGATVSGTIELGVDIALAPSTTISSVSYELDGAPLGQGLWTNNPEYSYNWNTATITDGDHALTALVTDTNGATSTANVVVTVNNGSADSGTNSTSTDVTDPSNGSASSTGDGATPVATTTSDAASSSSSSTDTQP